MGKWDYSRHLAVDMARWIDLSAVNGSFAILPCDDDDIEGSARFLTEAGAVGLGFYPKKNDGLKCADILSRDAESAGMTDTLIFKPDGLVVADFLLNKAMCGLLGKTPQKVVVIGSGPLAAAMVNSGIAPDVVLITENPAESADFSPMTEVTGFDSYMPHVKRTDLVLNCRENLAGSMDGFGPGAVFCDMDICSDKQSQALRRAKARGHRTIDFYSVLQQWHRLRFFEWYGCAAKG